MKKLLHDYGILQDTMCVFCDNTSAINLSKNPVQYSKSKHIEICYHFIQDLVEDKVVCLEFIHTDNQKADIFTKPLDGPQFVHDVNRSVRPLVLIQFLESRVCCVLYLYILLLFTFCRAHTCWQFVWHIFVSLLFVLDQSFLACVSKIQKHIKSRKSKSLIDLVEFCLKACFALYLCTDGLVHLRA